MTAVRTAVATSARQMLRRAEGRGMTKGPFAAMSLWFLNNTLDPRITFTRASSGTHFDSTGRLVTDANDVARFDYDPATPAGTVGGELYPGFFGTISGIGAGWAVSGGVATATATTAILNDGSNFASYVTGKTYQVTVTVTSRSAGTFHIYLRGNQVALNVSTPGTYTYTAVAGTNSSEGLALLGVGGFTGTVSNISIREVTFTPRGLLIEESRQNLCLQANSVTSAPWAVLGTPSPVAAVSLDGTSNATTITNSGSTVGYYQNITVAGSTTYTISRYVKKVSGSGTLFQFGSDTATAWGAGTTAVTNFNLDTFAFTGTSVGATTGYQSIGGGWYRVWITATTVASPPVIAIIGYAATPTSSLTMWGSQLEVGAFATSIIPTTTTALTRAADSASMTGTNFSSWFNAAAGTFVAEFGPTFYNGSGGTSGVFSANDNSPSNKIDFRATTGQAIASGGTGWNIATGSPTLGTINKVAIAYAAGAQSASRNGAAVVTASAAVLPSGINRLQIGGLDSLVLYQLNGPIRSLRFYSTALPNATIQALTT